MNSKIKNSIIRVLFSSSNQPIDAPKTINNILVVSTTGLGDTLWSTPAIQRLREKYPQVKIYVLTSEVGEEVLQNNPYIENIFVFKKPYVISFFQNRAKLKKLQLDYIFIFHASQRLVFPLCASLNCSYLIGTEGQNKGLDSLFTFLYAKKPIHEAQKRLEQISYVGANSSPTSLQFYFKNPSIKQSQEKKSILLHPGAKDRYKCWPVSCYKELADKLIRRGFSVFLSGSTAENDLLLQIQQKTPEVQIIKETSIEQLAKKMQQMHLLITNDTGPMHLATALDVPVLAFFAPTDPKKCGPFQAKKAILVQGNKTCSPCLQRKCRKPFCMLQFSPEQVLQKTEEILTNES